ncbi:putative quinol monooxygenase [Prolixibacteraceae bacterium]|nr:putative quinol monooxygenase [Prolixibacteraceae bacterium]
MIIVTVDCHLKEENKESYLNTFNEVSKTVHKEGGCIRYEIFQKDADSPNLFIFEKWESQEALDAHIATPHMNVFFEKTNPWLEKELEINVFDVKS